MFTSANVDTQFPKLVSYFSEKNWTTVVDYQNFWGLEGVRKEKGKGGACVAGRVVAVPIAVSKAVRLQAVVIHVYIHVARRR